MAFTPKNRYLDLQDIIGLNKGKAINTTQNLQNQIRTGMQDADKKAQHLQNQIQNEDPGAFDANKESKVLETAMKGNGTLSDNFAKGIADRVNERGTYSGPQLNDIMFGPTQKQKDEANLLSTKSGQKVLLEESGVKGQGNINLENILQRSDDSFRKNASGLANQVGSYDQQSKSKTAGLKDQATKAMDSTAKFANDSKNFFANKQGELIGANQGQSAEDYLTAQRNSFLNNQTANENSLNSFKSNLKANPTLNRALIDEILKASGKTYNPLTMQALREGQNLYGIDTTRFIKENPYSFNDMGDNSQFLNDKQLQNYNALASILGTDRLNPTMNNGTRELAKAGNYGYDLDALLKELNYQQAYQESPISFNYDSGMREINTNGNSYWIDEAGNIVDPNSFMKNYDTSKQNGANTTAKVITDMYNQAVKMGDARAQWFYGNELNKFMGLHNPVQKFDLGSYKPKTAPGTGTGIGIGTLPKPL